MSPKLTKPHLPSSSKKIFAWATGLFTRKTASKEESEPTSPTDPPAIRLYEPENELENMR